MPPRALAEQTRVIRSANADLRVAATASGLAELAAAINELAGAYRAAQREGEARAAEARARLEEERNRLAALMSELSEGVLVCNADGRILLYNEQARALFAAPGAARPRSRRSDWGARSSRCSTANRSRTRRTSSSAAWHAGESPPSARFRRGHGVRGACSRCRWRRSSTPRRGSPAWCSRCEDVTGARRARRSAARCCRRSPRACARRRPTSALPPRTSPSFPEMTSERRAQFVEIVAIGVASALGDHQRGAARVRRCAQGRACRWRTCALADLLEFARLRIEAALGVPRARRPSTRALGARGQLRPRAGDWCTSRTRLRDEYGVRGAAAACARRRARLAELDLGWRGADRRRARRCRCWESEPMEVGRASEPAHRARRARAARRARSGIRRGSRVRARAALPGAARARRRRSRAPARAAGREPARVLRLRPVPRRGVPPTALNERRLADAHLHRVRHRDHRAGALRRRRDHQHRRGAHRQRPAAQATRCSSSWSIRGGRCNPESVRVHGIDAGGARAASRRSARCCRHSTGSARTRSWSRTTPPSTCASSSSSRRRPACGSRSRCSTRCCCRRSRIRRWRTTGSRRSPSAWACDVIGRHTALGDALLDGGDLPQAAAAARRARRADAGAGARGLARDLLCAAAVLMRYGHAGRAARIARRRAADVRAPAALAAATRTGGLRRGLADCEGGRADARRGGGLGGRARWRRAARRHRDFARHRRCARRRRGRAPGGRAHDARTLRAAGATRSPTRRRSP